MRHDGKGSIFSIPFTLRLSSRTMQASDLPENEMYWPALID